MTVARAATPGKGFDTASKPTRTQLEALKVAGYSWGARYVPLPNNAPGWDIDAIEITLWMEVDLQLLLVQHVRSPPWDPRAHSGAFDGATAADWARIVGYPLGAHVFLDLEGIQGDAAGTIVFANAWAERVYLSGYRAGLYVGYDVPLTPEQLYEGLSHDCYWSDMAERHVAERGFAVKQGKQHTIDGLTIDDDVIAPDNFGAVPVICAAE